MKDSWGWAVGSNVPLTIKKKYQEPSTNRANQKRIRDARRADGMCIKCGQAYHAYNRVKCDDCLMKGRAYKRNNKRPLLS